MKKFSIAAALAVLTIPALAASDAITGYRCDNMCPLATTANTHRAYGTEALSASKIARADVAAQVTANLAKV